MTDPHAHYVLDVLPAGETLIANAVGVNHIKDGTLRAIGWLGISHNWIGFHETESATPHNEIRPATGVQSFEFNPFDARATVVFQFDDGSSLEFDGNAVELSQLLTALNAE
jgi:hypothetical protein